MFIQLSISLFLISLSFFILRLIKETSKSKKSSAFPPIFPNSYPIIGSFFAIISNRENRMQWITQILQSSPSATFTLDYLFGRQMIFTANPANVRHILKTHFSNYPKGPFITNVFFELLGNGIFNVDGESWKFQRKFTIHEFSTKSLCKFVQTVVDIELHDRLIPMLSAATVDKTVLDLQDILQRFAFDNVCRIACGFDPACLSSSSPSSPIFEAYEDAIDISMKRFRALLPISWKIKRFFNVGSEKKLKIAVSRVRDFALKIVREKKQELADKSSLEYVDLLSRFLSSGHSDENFATDIVISFIHASRGTTSAALTWVFWLISKNPQVEKHILKEIKGKSDMLMFEEVRDMVYTHASLCECMRLYPPLPADSKMAVHDDVFPDGTIVKKGTIVTYHPYAMGRMEKLWGSDWEDFKPERWLQRDGEGNWSFVWRDLYTYPVFQAGPRICLGKELAFLQMKRAVAGVLRRFKVVPTMEDGVEPSLIVNMTSKMKGGFPVMIEEREDHHS